MSQEPTATFLKTFSEQLGARLVRALRRAYDTACEHYEPHRGNNLKTFGFELYHCAVHELCAEADQESSGLSILVREPSFRLLADAFEIACHRVGYTVSENIWGAFPKNEGAACQMVEQSLWLEGFAPNLEEASRVVLAHLGNPTDGLQAVYICIPSRSANQRIVEWGVVHEVWLADPRVTIAADVRPTEYLEPEESVEDAELRRRNPPAKAKDSTDEKE